jgi:hypothetical protein
LSRFRGVLENRARSLPVDFLNGGSIPSRRLTRRLTRLLTRRLTRRLTRLLARLLASGDAADWACGLDFAMIRVWAAEEEHLATGSCQPAFSSPLKVIEPDPGMVDAGRTF